MRLQRVFQGELVRAKCRESPYNPAVGSSYPQNVVNLIESARVSQYQGRMTTTGLPQLLKIELLRRARMNPSYSLRAFAKSLLMDPSTLSKVRSGKRRLGKAASGRLAKRLGLDAMDLCAVYDQHNSEETETLCDWQDFAILEQVSITGFRPTKETLAEPLGLKQSEIEL